MILRSSFATLLLGASFIACASSEDTHDASEDTQDASADSSTSDAGVAPSKDASADSSTSDAGAAPSKDGGAGSLADAADAADTCDDGGLPGPVLPPCAPGSPKRVFITSAGVTGDLRTAGSGSDGFAGADNLCMAEAASANLCGTWKAFLGGWHAGQEVDPVARFTGNGPWYAGNGEVAFADKDALRGAASESLNWFANGTPSSVSLAWTGVAYAPGVSAKSCRGTDGESWTTSSDAENGHVGTPLTAGYWRAITPGGPFPPTDDCSVPNALYCFEQ
jgi:hypothetical protein